jgi:hypothetical protein
VLNGEPYIRYNLRALYPFAHEIIVVEGACQASRNTATADGHSQDHTLTILNNFRELEDPEDKVKIVTAEDEGFKNGWWPEKDEMSQAYAKRATGNYLWQVDSDEFYHSEDIQSVINMLQQDKKIKAISFKVKTFWGGLDYITDGILLRRGAQDFHRLFAWQPGYKYVTHRPPTVIDENGRNLRTIKSISAEEMTKRGINLYHYSFVFPFQVKAKLDYHGLLSPLYLKKRSAWASNYFSLKNPFFVDDTSVVIGPSWLTRFHGEHPAEIQQLWRDIEEGQIDIERRNQKDLEELLAKHWYRVATRLLSITWKPVYWFYRAIDIVRTIVHRGTVNLIV